MRRRLALSFSFVAAASLAGAEAVEVSGTVCRANRAGDRLIVSVDKTRHPVVIERSARVSFEGAWYEAEDIRPGDKLQLFAERAGTGVLRALRVDVQVRVADALFDALLGTRPRLIGRFAVREAQTMFFSLNVPGNDYVRVDARTYGSKRISALRPGDLLEISGTWTDKKTIRSSTIRVLTDDEPGGCRRDARRGETPQQTAAREGAEQRFLDGRDIEEEKR